MNDEPIPFYPNKFFQAFSYKSPENYDVINKITVDWLSVYIDIYNANLDFTDDEYANELLKLFQSFDFNYEFDSNHESFLHSMELEKDYNDHNLNGAYHNEIIAMGNEDDTLFVPLEYKNSIKTFATNFLSIVSEKDYLELEKSGLSYFVRYNGIVKKAYKTNYNTQYEYNHYVLLIETNDIKTYVSVPNFNSPLKIGEEITVYGLLNPFVSPVNNRLSVISLGWFK